MSHAADGQGGQAVEGLGRLESLEFKDHSEGPLLEPPFPEFVLADPVVLAPAESPDGRWHLFAHSLAGLNHYVSADGLSFRHRPGRVVYLAMRPFVFREGDTYYLFYEKLTSLRRWPAYESRLEVRRSKDLERWSEATVALAPSLSWHRTLNQVGNLGNACLVKVGGEYRLYYSAGLMYLPDCRFCEPRYTGMAVGSSPEGPFVPEPWPQETSDDGSLPMNVCTATRVYPAADRFVGLQTCIWREGRHSRAGIRVVASADGRRWEAKGPPFIRPDLPWKKSHVYVGDLKQAGSELRIYYNGRNGWAVGRECLGLAVAKLPPSPAGPR